MIYKLTCKECNSTIGIAYNDPNLINNDYYSFCGKGCFNLYVNSHINDIINNNNNNKKKKVNNKNGFYIEKCSDCGQEVIYRTKQKEYICYKCTQSRNIRARDKEYLVELKQGRKKNTAKGLLKDNNK